MSYPGRVLLPLHADKDYIWKGSQLLRRAYTDPAEQLAAKEMKIVEDTDPVQVPTSTDESLVVVQGAHTFQQLGKDSMVKLIGGCP